MQVTNKEFNCLLNALLLLQNEFLSLSPKEQEVIMRAEESIGTILERQAEMNRKTYAKIKEKRKTNPNYGRPKREWKRERRTK